MHAFNKANTVIIVRSYGVLLLFLLFLGSSRVIFFKIVAKLVKVYYLNLPGSFFFIPT